jgi:hypothetical protein
MPGVGRHDQQAEGVRREGTTGRQTAAVAAFHAALRENMVEKSAEQLQHVQGSHASACTARFAVGEGDGVFLARDDTAIGDGNPEAIGARYLQAACPS